MILDTLPQMARYETLHPLFGAALAYLRQLEVAPALGRHEIAGESCFALVQHYQTKPEETALFEAHQKYIDVQYLHQGQETILWAPLAAMQEQTMAYDVEKDAALWKLIPQSTPLRMQAGHVAILYPEDAHAPCIQWEGASEVLKVVIKVAVRG